MADDADWLAAAARLAMRARPLSRPNPGVGAIIVKHGQVAGYGWTQPGGRPHAEAMAVAMAMAMAGPAAQGATLYSTLEPCAHRSARGPSCASTLVAAGLARCVFAVIDPDPRTAGQGQAMMQAGGMAADHVPCPACEESLIGYLTRARLARPHVTLKLAASADGCTTRPAGESPLITGPAARAHVHAHRAKADAILVGGGTWRADQPQLDVRLPGLEDRSPQRVVLTRSAIDGVTTISAPAAIAQLDGVQYLYVEGGGATAHSFLAADLVDRIELYQSPVDIGGVNTLAALGIAALSPHSSQPPTTGWTLRERRTLGSDSYAAYSRSR